MAEYIDREALKERLEDFSKWCRDGRKQGVDFVLDCPLPDMPTADVQEVKHGAWNVLQRRMNSDIVQCSNCKEEFYYAKGHLQIGKMLYCPNCGAKMDGIKGAE